MTWHRLTDISTTVWSWREKNSSSFSKIKKVVCHYCKRGLSHIWGFLCKALSLILSLKRCAHPCPVWQQNGKLSFHLTGKGMSKEMQLTIESAILCESCLTLLRSFISAELKLLSVYNEDFICLLVLWGNISFLNTKIQIQNVYNYLTRVTFQ